MSELFPDYRPSWETDQHRDLRKHAAEFFRKEATPNEDRWVAQHAVDREFWNKAGAAGLLGLDLPEEFGGTGGDFAMQAVVQEELVYAHDQAFGFAVHSPIVAHYVYAYGNDDQRRRWLPKIISGDAVLAVAMTEPGTRVGPAVGEDDGAARRRRCTSSTARRRLFPTGLTAIC